MTPAQQLQDDILALEAQAHGKRVELTLLINKDEQEARKHMRAMYACTNARRDLRIAIQTEQGGCFFDAAGAVDRELGAPAHA